MKTLSLSLCSFLVIGFNCCFAFNNLTISDPKSPWYRYGKGSIDTATFVLEPKGIYSELSLYLTFSSKATNMNLASDTLETVFNFDLPDNSLITDSWLWIDNQIVQADILDKWSARNIYEGIVKRQKDPSILFKNGNQYELRIYPVLGNQGRKVKLKILLLNKWSENDGFVVNLPLNILNAASNAYCGYNNFCDSKSGIPNSCKILVKNNENFKLTSESQEIFAGKTDTLSYNYNYAIFTSNTYQYNKAIKFEINKPKQQLYFNSFSSNNDEGYYQLVMFPNKILDLPIKRKVVFVIDYDNAKSSFTPEQIFRNLKNSINQNLFEKDSFAIFFSGLIIEGSGNKWIGGDSTSKANLFNTISETKIKGYSNLIALLGKASEFVNTNKGGDIVVISASDHGYNSSNSNSLINDYVATLPLSTRVYNIDLLTNPTSYQWSGNGYIYGDAYFYQTLCRLTKGIQTSLLTDYYYNRTEPSYIEMIDNIFSEFSGKISTFDVYTSLNDGFCYDRLNFSKLQNISLTQAIIQTGKFIGKFPLTINLTGSYNGSLFNKKISINENEISRSDSTTKTIWNGKYLLDLEKGIQSNSIINDIITTSLNNRILTNYTAFLALEPAQGGNICSTCIDESKIITNIIDNDQDSISISVNPNPITSNGKITITDRFFDNTSSKLSIINYLGEEVILFNDLTLYYYANQLIIDLDIHKFANLSSGIYLLKYVNHGRTETKKLIINK